MIKGHGCQLVFKTNINLNGSKSKMQSKTSRQKEFTIQIASLTWIDLQEHLNTETWLKLLNHPSPSIHGLGKHIKALQRLGAQMRLYQLDVKSASLNGVFKDIHLEQPLGSIIKKEKEMMYKKGLIWIYTSFLGMPWSNWWTFQEEQI